MHNDDTVSIFDIEKGADLSQADLFKSRYRDADLSGAGLTRALLSDADLSETNLESGSLLRVSSQPATLPDDYHH